MKALHERVSHLKELFGATSSEELPLSLLEWLENATENIEVLA